VKRLLVVTTNDGKFREFLEVLSSPEIIITRLNREYPEIQADSLEEVVEFGAHWLKGKARTPFVIDDSGLFIGGLRGFPGVYSSHAYKTVGNEGILRLMEGRTNRKAYFKTVIGLFNGGNLRIFVGTRRGSITETPRGSNGFGFDPIFCPSGSGRTFAEMTTSEKNEISHRGIALRKLKRSLALDAEKKP
jgi:XTP/dITP diphosphohydrolase